MRRERIHSLGAILAFGLLPFALSLSTGCERSCHDLADTLCSQPGTDERTCEAWRERTSRVPVQTCELALRSWKRDRTR